MIYKNNIIKKLNITVISTKNKKLIKK